MKKKPFINRYTTTDEEGDKVRHLEVNIELDLWTILLFVVLIGVFASLFFTLGV